MTKTSGLGDRFYVQGVDVSGDVGSIKSLSSPTAVLEVPGIDKSAMERIPGLRDGQVEFLTYFNVDAGGSFQTLKALPTSDVILTYGRGANLGDASASLVAKQLNHDAERADDGGFTFSVSADSNGYGLEWGVQLTPGVRADGATPTNGDSVDFGTGSTDFGLQAFLHVTAIASGSATIKLQESSDDGDSDSFADVTGGSFGSQSGVGAARLQTARDQTVEQYLRVVTTGTFTGLSFVVHVCRNDTEVVY